MTEEVHNPNQPLASYEELRDSARGEAASLWKAADREEEALTNYYEALADDPRFTDEYRSTLAWRRYHDAKEKIVGGRQKASEQLAANAATYHRQSLPMPGGEGPITQDVQKILVTQNEAARISRKVSRIQEAGRAGPFRPDVSSTLKEEYHAGLNAGGVMGGALCRAVLTVADEYGVGADSVVDTFRQPRHRELIERAHHAEHLQQYIGKRLSEPPFPKPASEKARIAGIGTGGRDAEEPHQGASPPKRARTLFPSKPQSHVSKGSAGGGIPVPPPDEISGQRAKPRKSKRTKKG